MATLIGEQEAPLGLGLWLGRAQPGTTLLMHIVLADLRAEMLVSYVQDFRVLA